MSQVCKYESILVVWISFENRKNYQVKMLRELHFQLNCKVFVCVLIRKGFYQNEKLVKTGVL